MQDTTRRAMKLCFSFIVCFLSLFSTLPLAAQDVYLCVWRNPERTMTKIFPEARDYKTMTVAISDEVREVIEGKLGFELLPGQQDLFQYFEMTGDGGQVIGTIIAASQKGEYGAVEFVFGLDTDLTLKDIYIQRARERDRDFKKREFLDLFVGRSFEDILNFDVTLVAEPTPGATAVIQGVAKELVAFEALVRTF